MKVMIVPYNCLWPEMFYREAGLINAILAENLVGVYHIGSTAVTGLKAKPVIDIMTVVRDIKAVDQNQTAFEALGYEVMGEFGIPGRRYMRKGGDNRTHQVHSFQYDDTDNILRHLAFRDYLRANTDLCAQYAEIKTGLAAKYPDDIESYSNGKDLFVKTAEQKALQWYWRRLT